MNKKNLTILLTSLTLATGFFSSCQKDEGEGGKGSIYGTVYKIIDDGQIIKSGDSYVFAVDTIVARSENVYIHYGSNQTGYDDKTGTAENGTFNFKYLTDGNYTVYTFSDLASGEKTPVSQTVKISDGNSVDAGTFYITDGKNSGKSGVVGKLTAQYMKSEDTEAVPAVGERVYIKAYDGTEVLADTRTDDTGMFSFPKLEPNTRYYVYAVSELSSKGPTYAEGSTVETGEAGTIVVSDNLNVALY